MLKEIFAADKNDAFLDKFIETFPEEFDEFMQFADKALTEAVMTTPDLLLQIFTRLASSYVHRIEEYIESGKAAVLAQDGIWNKLEAITNEFFEIEGITAEQFLAEYDRAHPNLDPFFMVVLADHLALAIDVNEEGFADESYDEYDDGYDDEQENAK